MESGYEGVGFIQATFSFHSYTHICDYNQWNWIEGFKHWHKNWFQVEPGSFQLIEYVDKGLHASQKFTWDCSSWLNREAIKWKGFRSNKPI